MIERVHMHIIEELEGLRRADTFFGVTISLFNLLSLGVSSSLASSSDALRSTPQILILGVMLTATVVLNAVAFSALKRGRSARSRLLQGLLQLYEDQNVSKYYDASLGSTDDQRSFSFAQVVLILGGLAIVIPLIALLF